MSFNFLFLGKRYPDFQQKMIKITVNSKHCMRLQLKSLDKALEICYFFASSNRISSWVKTQAF